MSEETILAQNDTEAISGQEGNGEGVEPKETTEQTPDNQQQEQTEQKENEEGKEQEEKDNKVEGAPEQYEPYQVEEGVNINDIMLGKFNNLAKELNLSQGNAQKLIDLASENATDAIKLQKEQWDGIREGWVSDIKSDKEFGGEKFKETISLAKKALKQFGDKEMTAFLDSTGYGDNPGIIKMLAKIGKAMGEDRIVDGTPNNEVEESQAEIMYKKK